MRRNSRIGSFIFPNYFGWKKSSPQNSPLPSVDATTEKVEIKHLEPEKKEEGIDEGGDWVNVRSTLKMRTSWQNYNQLEEKDKIEALNEIVKLFIIVCPTCNCSAFRNSFGDGIIFANVITKRFYRDVESVIGTKISMDKIPKLIREILCLFSDEKSGNDFLHVLSVLSKEKSIAAAISDSKLPSIFVRLLEIISLMDTSHFSKEQDEKLSSICDQITKILEHLVQVKTVVNDLKNADSFSKIIRVITSKGNEQIHLNIKKNLLKILESSFLTTDSYFVDHLFKKKAMQILLHFIHEAKSSEFQTISIAFEAVILLLKKAEMYSNYKFLKEFYKEDGNLVIFERLYECEIYFDSHPDVLSRMVDSATSLLFIGEKNMKNGQSSIKNCNAFQALSDIFLKSQNVNMQKKIIESMIFIFSENQSNYAAVHHLHNIAVFIKHLESFNDEIQTSVLKLLEFIVAGLNFTPFEELCSLSTLLTLDISANLAIKVFATIVKLIRFDDIYKEKFRDAKLIEVLIDLFQNRFNNVKLIKENESNQKEMLQKLLDSVIPCFECMFNRCPKNVEVFRKFGGIKVMEDIIIHEERFRGTALAIFHILIAEDKEQKDMDVLTLIELIQTSPNVFLKKDILNLLKRACYSNPNVKDVMKNDGGYIAAISALISTHTLMPNEDCSDETIMQVLEIIEAVFVAMAASLSDNLANKEIFLTIIGKSSVSDALLLNKPLFKQPYQDKLLQLLFDFATERCLGRTKDEMTLDHIIIPAQPRLVNPFVMGFIFDMIHEFDEKNKKTIIAIVDLFAKSSPKNLEGLCNIQIMSFILKQFEKEIFDEKSALHEQLIHLIQLVCTYRLTTEEWRHLFSLLQKYSYSIPLLKCLAHAAANGNATPYLDFESPSSCVIPSFEYPLHNSNGYTFSCWISFQEAEYNPNNQSDPLFILFELLDASSTSLIQVGVRPWGGIEVTTDYKKQYYTKYKVVANKWYHIVVTHKKDKNSAKSNLTLYVNGKFAETKPVGYIAGPQSKVLIGKHDSEDYFWRLGPVLLYDEVINDATVASLYVAHSSYLSYYQGEYIPSMNAMTKQLYPNYIILNRAGYEHKRRKFSVEDVVSIKSIPLIQEKIVFCFNAERKLYGPSGTGLQLQNIVNGNLFANLEGKISCCIPGNIANSILSFDGLILILCLIEGCDTDIYLNESLNLLNNLMRHPIILEELERLHGLDILGTFLKKKGPIINITTLNILWDMVVGGTDEGREILANLRVLSLLLLDYEIWKKTDIEVQRCVYAKIAKSLYASQYGKWNAIRLKSISIVDHLLQSILNDDPPIEIVESIVHVLGAILMHDFTEEDMKSISNFIQLTMDKNEQEYQLIKKSPTKTSVIIAARNLLLKILCDLILPKKENLDIFTKSTNTQWFAQFLIRKTHPVSVVLSLRLLTHIIIQGLWSDSKIEKFLFILEHFLAPYCNQYDIYVVLIRLVLGKSSFRRYHEDPEQDLETFIKRLRKKNHSKAPFTNFLPVILSMLKYNYRTEQYAIFEPVSTTQYFEGVDEHEKSFTIKRRWTMVKQMIAGVSNFRQKDHSETESNPNTPTTPPAMQDYIMIHSIQSNEFNEEEVSYRKRLTSAILQFLNELFDLILDIKKATKKTDVIKGLVEIIFADSTNLLYVNESMSTISKRRKRNIPQDVDTEAIETIIEHLFSTKSANHIFSILTSTIIWTFENFKGLDTLEEVLDATPFSILQQYRIRFQEIIYYNVIRHFMDVHSTNQVVENSKLAYNLTHFGTQIVDMHYNGIGTNLYELTPKFLCDLIKQLEILEAKDSKIKTLTSGITSNLPNVVTSNLSSITSSSYLQTAFRALNRMILYLLSPLQSNQNPIPLEEAFQNIFGRNWLMVTLSPLNKDQEFFSCLCYLAFTFLVHNSEKIRESAQMTWKLLMTAQSAIGLNHILVFKSNTGETVDFLDGFSKILEKDPINFITWLSDESEKVNKYFEEHLMVTLENYKNAELKKIQNYAQSEQNRTKNHLILLEKQQKRMSEEITNLIQTIDTQIENLKKTFANFVSEKREKEITRSIKSTDLWKLHQDVLCRDRCVWKLEKEMSNYYWKLDDTEGPLRQRKKMEFCRSEKRRDPYPKNPIRIPENQRIAQLKNQDDMLRIKNLKGFSPSKKVIQNEGETMDIEEIREMKLDEKKEEIDKSEDDISEKSETPLTSSPAITIGSSQTQDEIFSDENIQEQQKIKRLLDSGDTIKTIYNCLRIKGLDGQKGLFIICDKSIYIIDNYNLNDEKEIVEVNGEHSTTVAFQQNTQTNNISHPCIKLPYNLIKEVHKRRFLLSYCALEFFCKDGTSYFIAFQKSELDSVYYTKQIYSKRVPDWKKKAMITAWQNGEISNFEYLMFLNTLAGRSFNDLTQYPVFPWVIADYTSDQLDLSDPKIYRDLSKPMGALTEKSRQLFQERYEIWDHETIPKFHYGTHYSSAGGVLYYLMRLEPYTSQYIELQDGKLDIPDRLFHSIYETWISASTERTMSDVKELTPEFYYLPEFLVNYLNIQFGTKQNGELVHHVKLPPWAKNSPHEFIRIQRKALESDYVSERLNDWIDLIFGYKQTGKEAEKACNVFFYLTYEGQVDIDAIESEVERRATIAQISNFGQTPHQLFKKPHPKRNKQTVKRLHVHVHPEELQHLQIKQLSKPVGQIVDNKDPIVLPVNCLFARSKNSYFSWGYYRSIRLLNSSDQVIAVFENVTLSSITCASIGQDGRLLILGCQDGSIVVYKIKQEKKVYSLKLVGRLCGHTKSISCLTTSDAYSIIVSGSADTTCIVWDLNRLRYVRELKGNAFPVNCVTINERTGDIIMGAHTSVFVYTINGVPITQVNAGRYPISSIVVSNGPEWHDDNVIITGHKDGEMKIWRFIYEVKKGEFQISLKMKIDKKVHKGEVTSLVISEDLSKLYSGDEKGVVYCWSIPVEMTSHFLNPDVVENCQRCNAKFTLLRTKNNCRNCGRVVCQECSSNKKELPHLHYHRLVRVCDDCFELLMSYQKTNMLK